MRLRSRTTRITAFALAVLSGSLIVTTMHAGEDQHDGKSAKVRLGFQIAPVPLNLDGKDRELVGLGSYIVNAQMPCNDCHSAGPMTQYVPGGNPFFGQQPTKTNPATYLGGGRDFGPLVPNSPSIVARNLTPDKSGLPVGGDSFAKFFYIMKSGSDFDHRHPNCSATVTTNCLPRPFDGDLLQIMPWPSFADMTSQDLLAIYEYLRSIPCVEGGPGEPSNRCQ